MIELPLSQACLLSFQASPGLVERDGQPVLCFPYIFDTAAMWDLGAEGLWLPETLVLTLALVGEYAGDVVVTFLVDHICYGQWTLTPSHSLVPYVLPLENDRSRVLGLLTRFRLWRLATTSDDTAPADLEVSRVCLV